MWLLIHAGIRWQDISQYLVSDFINQYRPKIIDLLVELAPKTTKLFHSPDVRHLTIEALLCGRQVWTVETV